ncbi:MAG: radical SAM protein [Armatimonadetes bacterium]|nr:radical SAM protein [Armatimonadota bacterium]
MPMQFDQYSPQHAARLRARFAADDWQAAVADGAVDAARRGLRMPPKVANVFSLPVEQLKAINEARVRALIEAGERDEERLLAALGTWPECWPEGLPVRLSFLGLNLTLACDMAPRCVYCNQRPVDECMTVGDWRQVLAGLTPDAPDQGVYVYFTGGEPLLLGEDLWGPQGLVRAAGDAGTACNVNTNGLALTPAAALGLVSSGTGRLHLSLDTHRPEVGDAIHQRAGRWEQVVRGLHNLQIAKALLAAAHPVIHLNCVLTCLNANDFPAFLRFVLSMKPLAEEGLSPDLDFHVIPVGGDQNWDLRLTAAQYERFFSETWAAAEAVWEEYRDSRNVPEDKRKDLAGQMPFMSPYHRVAQRGELAAWAERAAAGRPGALAISPRCYVAPTQGFVLPDGNQYWCGGHATSRPEPVGNVRESSVAENIRAGLGQLQRLPSEFCRTCPGATLAINQTVEQRLRQAIREWLNPGTNDEAVEPPPVD